MTTRLPAACAALWAMIAAPPAWAIGSCSGTYAATLLSPLPTPLAVGLVIRDDSPRNVDLASRFKAGLQQAGITVTGVANMQLSLVVTLSNDAGSGDDLTPPSDASFGWWNGGVDRQLPEQSRFGGNRQIPGPVNVRLRAELRASPADPVAWVGTLKCAMQGSDERQLAYDIGTVIGGAMGRRVERTPF